MVFCAYCAELEYQDIHGIPLCKEHYFEGLEHSADMKIDVLRLIELMDFVARHSGMSELEKATHLAGSAMLTLSLEDTSLKAAAFSSKQAMRIHGRGEN